jgi:hypothetical protein
MAMREYEVRPRKDKRGVDLISDALPFGKLWYAEPNAVSNAVDYAKFRSRSHDAVIRVYDEAGNVIETHEHRPLDQKSRSIAPFSFWCWRFQKIGKCSAALLIAAIVGAAVQL